MSTVCGNCSTIDPLHEDPEYHSSVLLRGVPYVKCFHQGRDYS